MLLKNQVARLITINGKFENGQRVKAYQIKPGNNPAVEVPNELCENTFVKTLIADGSLLVQCEDDASVSTAPSEYDGMSKSDLVALCEAQGIDVAARDTKFDLIAKLESVDE